jgi:hypothetical protein
MDKDVTPLATCAAIVGPLHRAWTQAVNAVLAQEAEREATSVTVAVG